MYTRKNDRVQAQEGKVVPRKGRPLTEGQRFLLVWALSSSTWTLVSTNSVPVDAPSGVDLRALRGLQRRGLFVEHKEGFFTVIEAAKAHVTLDEINKFRERFGWRPLWKSLVEVRPTFPDFPGN